MSSTYNNFVMSPSLAVATTSETNALSASSKTDVLSISSKTNALSTPSETNLLSAAPRAKKAERCRLLELPGELKNDIYRLVVITSTEDNTIDVTSSGYARSALLQTCKEIHDE